MALAASPDLHAAALAAWEAGDHMRAHGLMAEYVRSRVEPDAFNDFAVMAEATGDRAAARAMLRAALVLDAGDADARANLQEVDGSLTATLLRRFAEHWGSERPLDYEDVLPPYKAPPESDDAAARVAGEVIALAPHMESFYARLDERSRELVVASLLIRALGRRMAPPPLDVTEYRALSERARELVVERAVARDGLCGSLDRFDLRPLGIPLEVVSHEIGIVTFFLLGQYRLLRADATVVVEPGDVVVDAGACWGDTSVYFAHLAGPDGRVVALEFDPFNVEILERNLGLNPGVAGRVVLDRRALYGESGHAIGFTPSGYGTAIGAGAAGTHSVQTTTIDDLVTEHRLSRVDLIKMDIEGAEGPSLLGAQRTLTSYRPKLAIAAYHRTDDLLRLPALIDGLAPGYRFHVDHYTLHLGETILYADPAD